jgi:hypothetical protein
VVCAGTDPSSSGCSPHRELFGKDACYGQREPCGVLAYPSAQASNRYFFGVDGRTGEAGAARWWETMEMEADVEADPVNPMLLFRELSVRPVVIDARTDPDVPPVPPHATFEQMKDAARALLKGDPSRWGVLKEGVKTKAQEFLPHHQGPDRRARHPRLADLATVGGRSTSAPWTVMARPRENSSPCPCSKKTSAPCRGTVFHDREGPRGPRFGSWCRGNRRASTAGTGHFGPVSGKRRLWWR